MDTLRIIARREGRISEKDVKLFYDSFLDSMKQYGRMFEMGIILSYKLRSGHLMGDAELGPAMMSKGKIHLLPKKIKGADKVAKIFTRFQEKAKEKAKKHG
jgi:heterodisulfide reductase subunit C